MFRRIFFSVEIEQMNITALLFQTGYFTIKEVEDTVDDVGSRKSYKLGYRIRK